MNSWKLFGAGATVAAFLTGMSFGQSCASPLSAGEGDTPVATTSGVTLDLTGTIPAHSYYLVQMTTTGTVGGSLPTPDAPAWLPERTQSITVGLARAMSMPPPLPATLPPVMVSDSRTVSAASPLLARTTGVAPLPVTMVAAAPPSPTRWIALPSRSIGPA